MDLVGWVMSGVQHIPRSEDVPVVRSAAAITHQHNDAQLLRFMGKEAAGIVLLLLQRLLLHTRHADVMCHGFPGLCGHLILHCIIYCTAWYEMCCRCPTLGRPSPSSPGTTSTSCRRAWCTMCQSRSSARPWLWGWTSRGRHQAPECPQRSERGADRSILAQIQIKLQRGHLASPRLRFWNTDINPWMRPQKHTSLTIVLASDFSPHFQPHASCLGFQPWWRRLPAHAILARFQLDHCQAIS